MDVCAEINAPAPPDQQRFYVSCEVTGLRSEKRYRLQPGAGVSLRAQSETIIFSLPASARHRPAFPASAPEAEAGKANTSISIDSWRDLRLVS